MVKYIRETQIFKKKYTHKRKIINWAQNLLIVSNAYEVQCCARYWVQSIIQLLYFMTQSKPRKYQNTDYFKG